MKITIIVLLLIGLIIGGFFGIKWIRVFTATDFDAMLNALYSKTVPLIKAEDIADSGEYLFIDTRLLKEYQVSHIEGAVFLNYDKPDYTKIEALPEEQEIIVYCSVGYRSEKIGEELQKRGFKHVKNLYGGIFGWVNSGGKVVDEKGDKTRKVHAYDASWAKWLNDSSEAVY
jgi:rhodanese-related sulfurtransferase